jgi:dTDP-4-dehydrorhamnose reductase
MKLINSRMVVLGPGGMLGQMVCSYFGKRVMKLIPFVDRFNALAIGGAGRSLVALMPDVVINCVGKIKQLTDDPNELLYGNAVLPLELRTILPSETILVHPSSDCVFNGKAAKPYRTGDPGNAEDLYGWSKYLGETALLSRPRTLIPRVSIIGPDQRRDGPGLFNWLFRQPNHAAVKGFTNHWWNGITTFEWCRQVEHLLETGNGINEKSGRVIQLGTAQPITKHELLSMVAATFTKPICVEPHATLEPVYRVLDPEVVCIPIKEQLLDLLRPL